MLLKKSKKLYIQVKTVTFSNSFSIRILLAKYFSANPMPKETDEG